jgi:hypothetical protein
MTSWLCVKFTQSHQLIDYKQPLGFGGDCLGCNPFILNNLLALDPRGVGGVPLLDTRGDHPPTPLLHPNFSEAVLLLAISPNRVATHRPNPHPKLSQIEMRKWVPARMTGLIIEGNVFSGLACEFRGQEGLWPVQWIESLQFALRRRLSRARHTPISHYVL